MEKPQNYISDELLIDDPDIREEEKAVKMVRIVK
jgi:hypothetical protein